MGDGKPNSNNKTMKIIFKPNAEYKIRQRKNRSAMDRSQAVQMIRMQRHLRLGIAVPGLEQFDVVARSELVAFEKFLDFFHDSMCDT